ncbi:cytosolic carboxypeptidase 3 isoform X7 [Pseudophryne corroboree]|uniref:cytosolic carboxypeptidase 3 isoform X7 n=1 Tax=Pseudophryne corroboree TaxID=495146 RepID=UPI00308193EF
MAVRAAFYGHAYTSSCNHTCYWRGLCVMEEQLSLRVFRGTQGDEDPYESETVSPYELYSAEHFYYPHPRTTQVVYENHCGRKLPRLREPRDLYGVSSASFFQLPRWPYECQVLRERIQHIEWNPPVPEPMYRSTGLEQELAGTEHLESKVIYQVKEGWKESYFMCSRVGGNRSPLKSDSSHSCEDPNITLEFESRFESGNLQKVVQVVMEEREIQLYCDLHGHSKKQNVFMYGCKGRGGQNGESRLCERIFPFMLSKNSPDQFSFSACKFRVQKNKEGTGRVVMWKMGIRNSYTLEATFCGSTLGKRRGTHFSTKDLESLGYHFCSSLLDYCDPEQTKYCVCLKELEEMVQQRVRYINPLSLQSESFYKDVLSDLDSSTGGSDSSDSNGPPAHLMELACRVKSRKKLLKSKRERNSHRKESERNLLQDPLDEDESTGEKAGAPIVDQQLTAMAVSRTFLQKNSAGSLEDLRDPISDLCSQEKPRNLPQVSRRNKMTLSKPQRQPLFQDLGAKKVSVIYLLFNANGEVITSKSHSYARNQGVMDVVSPLNGFHWNRPLPLFKNLFAQHFPLGSVLEPYCYSVTPAGSFSCKISGGFKSNTASDGCELDSGDRVHKPEKAPFPPSVYNQDKSSYSKRIWARELTLDMDTRCSLLPEPASQDLLPMNLRANGPALPPVLLDTEVLNVLHQTGNSLQSVNKTCTPALPNRDEQGGSSRITEEMQSFPHVKKMTSLPAVTTSTDAKLNIASDLYPTSATNIRHLRNILPKMRGHASASKSSSNANIPPSRRLKGRSMVHSSNGTVQKRKMGKPFCPRRQEDQTVSDSQHPDLSVNTWKDILIGLQTGQNPAAPKEDVLKHGTSNGFLNCTRKSGQRANLAPLPK